MSFFSPSNQNVFTVNYFDHNDNIIRIFLQYSSQQLFNVFIPILSKLTYVNLVVRLRRRRADDDCDDDVVVVCDFSSMFIESLANDDDDVLAIDFRCTRNED
ncbi:hypothetical protein DERP_003178 [Dermatophagoides pteronyssinus]|uniref:Uncharacterized protein n=1 Tax=Dermatophagoides pteronyssinus TaxID=6956 RepID=A0ABQ8JJ83_DERPT|nr:hypothetical protein DERP_003178 [Dermatophagoides pteronyssinus]